MTVSIPPMPEMPMSEAGDADGNLAFKFSGFLHPYVVLKYHPEIQNQLEEVVKQGWKFLFIQAKGTASAEVSLKNAPYHTRKGPGFWRYSRSTDLVLELSLGDRLPEVNNVPEVQEFRINVSSKSFPRATTVDLATGVVTYLDDPFWRWEKGWGADPKKLSDAKEIYEIATWLIDVKKFKLIDVLKPERYQELAETFKALPQ